MPEGHTVHRVARQFRRDFVGHPLAVSSPQGRFAAGAALIDGRGLTGSRAVGKQLFLEFDGGLVLRVHLGLYGAWDLYGDVSPLGEGERVRGSLGAPRARPGSVMDAQPSTRRLRMGEDESEHAAADDAWPPPPLEIGRAHV